MWLSVYRDCKECVIASSKLTELFIIETCIRQGCIMSQWLFNEFIDSLLRDVEMRALERGSKNG